MQKRIIFHYPQPLDFHANSGSGIRPVNIVNAFKKIGYEVDLITGYGKERKDCIKKIKKNIKNGEIYDFVYSESSTTPTALTEKSHIPLYPILDFMFFYFCKKKHIPVVLFYRDIYWKFSLYGKHLSPIKKKISILFYKLDLFFYKKTLNTLYLPSKKMAHLLPKSLHNIIKELPPGLENKIEVITNEKEKLNILYIGGMSELYEMSELFKTIKENTFFTLTICTRKNEWNNVKKHYTPYLNDNIIIVHKSGDDLIPLYKEANLVSYFIKPHEYLSFSSPIKLFEYIAYNKPILASKNTLTGEFVYQENIGWEIDYNSSSLMKLLEKLSYNPSLIEEKIKSIKNMKDLHTWEKRVQQVVNDLK